MLFRFLFYSLLTLLACKPKAPKEYTATGGTSSAIVHAFFESKFKSKGNRDGVWIADTAEVAQFFERQHISKYKPLPNEPQVSQIRENLKIARLFLRLDGMQCDTLFILNGDTFTVSVGQLKLLEKTKNKTAYSLILNSLDKSGKVLSEGAILVTDHSKKELILSIQNQDYRFTPEKRTAKELVEVYGKSLPKTGLVEY